MRAAVAGGLVPLLKAAPGFEGCWTMRCNDGDFALLSIFDTEANAHAAMDNIREWVNAHIRELVELPARAMFDGAADKLV
ncbi:MAG TPA: hypothetical protein VGI78_22780 [Acetobacteraceae bacterium]